MNRNIASICVVGVLCGASTAFGDIVLANWNSSNSYHAKLAHMPDFDQRRDNCCGSPGLPGDGGMHCVPTATMNMFCYAANHGFPWLDPGPGIWQSNLKYDEATNAISVLGALMGTTAANGTGGSGWKNGSAVWLAFFGNGLLTSSATYLDSNTTPTVNQMALKVCTGSVVAFAYGRYDVVGTIFGLPLLHRTGGHAVTFAEAKRNASTFYLRYRDPADDGTNATQSLFVNKEVTVTSISVVFDWAPLSIRTVHAIDYPSSDGKIRIVDGYVSVKPIWFLSFINTGGQYELKQFFPVLLGSSGISGNVAMGTIFGVKGLELELDGASALALVETSAAASLPKIRRFNLPEQTFVDLPIADAKAFITGRDGRIYVHDGSKLYCHKPDGSLESATSSIPTPTALAYDDVNDQIVVLSVPQRAIRRLNKNLSVVDTFIIPTSMPMAGDGSVIVNPIDQHVVFITDGSSQLGELTAPGAGLSFSQYTVIGLPTPKSLSPSDDGKIFASTVNGLRVLVQTQDAGWAIDGASPFHNLPITGRMASQRSRSNVDPLLHDTPDWNNILPEDLLAIGSSVIDCLGDLNSDNIVNGADIAVLLGAWGTADIIVDLNADGIVNGADMALLLGSWGACP